jgi:hypothetical protein
MTSRDAFLEAGFMHPPRVQLTLQSLLVIMAVAAAIFTLCTRSRDEFVLVAVIATGMLVFFTRCPTVTVQNPPDAIKIAVAHVMKVDQRFRPEKHVARAYRQSAIASWIVDFYVSGGASVIKRVKLSAQGSIRSMTIFTEDEQITSLTESSPLFILGRDGSPFDGSFQCDV